MKIAIMGTRGIPNNYGGFEQLAERLSLGLIQRGHEVFVYNSSHHPFKEKIWNGVHILHQYDPEKKIGTAGQFIYDLGCIISARRRNFDLILNLGYTSSAIWLKLFPKKTTVITNMDGQEWKRTKFSKSVQRFLKYSEKLAIRHSTRLVADSRAMQAYFLKTYGLKTHYIAYGADLFNSPNAGLLAAAGLSAFGYNLLIARMEPENNIEMILDGVAASADNTSFIVVGNAKNKFGSYLTEKYKNDSRIIFVGPVYDINRINNLRYFCNLYFHGHSVGGTNPSLLEAMGCQCLIAAHDNEFNRSVLENDAYYFTTSAGVTKLVEGVRHADKQHPFIVQNYRKIQSEYTWEKIVSQYEALMTDK